jgi:hypothetical protein
VIRVKSRLTFRALLGLFISLRGKEIPTRRDLAERALDEAQAAQFAALLPQKPPAAE